MRPIHGAHLDTSRPVLVLTARLFARTCPAYRSRRSDHRARPVTEVPVGPANGLDHDSVVSCDNIVTVPVDTLGRQLGFLLADQEPVLSEAIRTAFDLW